MTPRPFAVTGIPAWSSHQRIIECWIPRSPAANDTLFQWLNRGPRQKLGWKAKLCLSFTVSAYWRCVPSIRGASQPKRMSFFFHYSHPEQGSTQGANMIIGGAHATQRAENRQNDAADVAEVIAPPPEGAPAREVSVSSTGESRAIPLQRRPSTRSVGSVNRFSVVLGLDVPANRFACYSLAHGAARHPRPSFLSGDLRLPCCSLQLARLPDAAAQIHNSETEPLVLLEAVREVRKMLSLGTRAIAAPTSRTLPPSVTLTLHIGPLCYCDFQSRTLPSKM